MIWENYQIVKQLGSGAYGKVSLVKDGEGSQFALKVISRQRLEKDAYLIEYLQGQIQCMEQLKGSQHNCQLYKHGKDETNYYLLCEFCDMGNLLNCQAKQPNKVFTYQNTIKILVQVLKGLEDLHKLGYIHRDLKGENVLMKKQGNQIIYKLADFGFSKKQIDIENTTLGTPPFMAPQIFDSDKKYGYEVDVWAFGVLFFMLNMTNPFKITNCQATATIKKNQLVSQSKNFSYKKRVDNTLKKMTKNCTQEMQDLFLKIFQPDVSKRINFAEIRQHPVFSQHFPQVSQELKQLYKKKEVSVISISNSKLKNKPSVDHKTHSQRYQKQIQFVKFQCSKVNLLLQLEEQLMSNKIIDENLMLIYQYNANKLNLLVIKDFVQNKLTQEYLKKKQPNLRWMSFCEHQKFNQLIRHYKSELNEAEKKVKYLYNECKQVMNLLSKENSYFYAACTQTLQEDDFEGDFKSAYLLTTRKIYQKLRINYAGNHTKILGYIAVVTLSHIFWQIMYGPKDVLKKAFKTYFTDKTNKNHNLQSLKYWIPVADDHTIKQFICDLIENYFNHQ